MSGTLVHMGTGVPVGTHRNLENLGTAGYRVLARKKFWVPMGTGYRENFHLCRPLILSRMVVFWTLYLDSLFGGEF